MSYTYASYVSALQTMVVSQAPDVPFDTILPSCIDYAEQRLYRELDLLNTVQVDTSVNLVAGTRIYSIPGTFVAVNSINLLTPAGTSSSNGIRVPLVPVSLETVNILWPSSSVTAAPSMFGLVTQWQIVLGPSPDAAYTLEIIGTYRPLALSGSNTTTFLTTNLPDLFLAASMIFMSGYMRNFGAQASDPQQGMSWEQQYDLLFKSANIEEFRKKFQGSSWTSQPDSPAASNQRG